MTIATAAPRTERDELRVLVVDDDFLFADMLPRLLRRTIERPRLDIVSARTATEAVALLSSRTFDVLLCDYDLRTLETGLDVLRHAAAVAEPPLRVLVSGHSLREIPRTEPNVIQAFIEKPMTLREIPPLLTQLLREHLGIECRSVAPAPPREG